MAKVTNITIEEIDNGVLVTASSYDPDNYDPFCGGSDNNIQRIYAQSADEVPALLNGLFTKPVEAEVVEVSTAA